MIIKSKININTPFMTLLNFTVKKMGLSVRGYDVCRDVFLGRGLREGIRERVLMVVFEGESIGKRNH